MSEQDQEDHAARFVEAVALGAMADAEFAEACRALGLKPHRAWHAPIELLLTAGACRGTKH